MAAIPNLPYRPRCNECQKTIAEAHGVLDRFDSIRSLPEWLRDRVLDDIFWRLTEGVGPSAPHKFYEVRYRTPDAHASITTNGLRHDHVFQRSLLRNEVVAAATGRERAIAEKAVACIVTKEEHRRLGNYSMHDGWERYKKARLPVLDASKAPSHPEYWLLKPA